MFSVRVTLLREAGIRCWKRDLGSSEDTRWWCVAVEGECAAGVLEMALGEVEKLCVVAVIRVVAVVVVVDVDGDGVPWSRVGWRVWAGWLAACAWDVDVDNDCDSERALGLRGEMVASAGSEKFWELMGDELANKPGSAGFLARRDAESTEWESIRVSGWGSAGLRWRMRSSS